MPWLPGFVKTREFSTAETGKTQALNHFVHELMSDRLGARAEGKGGH